MFKQLGCFYGYLKQCALDAPLSLRVASCGTAEVAALCRQHGLASWKVEGLSTGRSGTQPTRLTAAWSPGLAS